MNGNESMKSFGELPTLGRGEPSEPEVRAGGGVSWHTRNMEAETLRPPEGIRDDGRTDAARRWTPGETILDRYVVERELGQGGMGVVYGCLDRVGGVRVAVKSLPPELSHNSVEMEEVRENFQLVYGLSHPNIAGARYLERDGSGVYYLVMEEAAGENLRRWLRTKWKAGGVTLAEAVGILRQVAAALDYAHGEKVIHRDVKPGNVMIDARGRVKVLDFGLASQIRTSLSRASHAYRGTSGTGPYMAPEQWRGRRQDGKTDQYALGVMAYEMLAGHLPFENDEVSVLREVVLKEEPEDIPGVPEGAMAAIRRAMSKNAAERFPTCGAFVDALESTASQGRASTPCESGAGTAAGKAAGTPEGDAAGKTARPESSPHHQRKGLGVGGWVAASVVAAAIGAGVWWGGWGRETARPEGPPHQGIAEEAEEEMRAAEERHAAERAAAEQAAKVEEERVEAERRAEEERLAAERAAEEKRLAEQKEKEAEAKRNAQEEAERVAQAVAEARRQVLAEVEAQRKAQEKAEAERVAQAVAEAMRKAQEEAEAKQKAKEDAEREAQRKAWDGTYSGEAREVRLPDGKTMRLHWCPEGSFTMGSPSTEEGRYNDEVQHKVTLSRGFWMAETEVTQGQWKALMNGETIKDLARKALQDDTGYALCDGKGASTMRERWGKERNSDPMDRCGDLNDDVPVYYVSWGEAKEFCRRLTERGRNEGWLPAGYSFRLPTEAEWEYACRAGTKTALPNAKDIHILGTNNAPALDDIAWYGGNSSVGFTEEGLDRALDTETWPEKQYPGGRAWTRKVKGKASNNWDLYDMIGNVWEWCEDESAGYPTGAVKDYCKSNGSTVLGVRRVMRGGSWFNYARYSRSANRSWNPAGCRLSCVGFRPVCSAGL